MDRINLSLLQQGNTFTLAACTTPLPDVSTRGFSILHGNIADYILVSYCSSSPWPQGSELHTTELPDSFTFRSSKQILSRDFTGCEVLTGVTPTTLTSAPGLYSMQAGVNKLPIS